MLKAVRWNSRTRKWRNNYSPNARM